MTTRNFLSSLALLVFATWVIKTSAFILGGVVLGIAACCAYFAYIKVVEYYNKVVKGWMTITPAVPIDEMKEMLETPTVYEYEINTGYQLGKDL
tara:strand:+ start:463 stop:744 length:282 start_codon:yes stop_codon:yes gene_type:complete